MNRRHFLESIGIGAAFALTATCLQSCKHESLVPPNNNSNTNPNTPINNSPTSFTINLDDPANVSLKKNGGYIVSNGIVIAKDLDGNYVAATQICSHANRAQVIFSVTQNEFYCSAHGARFSTTGVGQNSAGRLGLRTYKIVIEANLLRIFY